MRKSFIKVSKVYIVGIVFFLAAALFYQAPAWLLAQKLSSLHPGLSLYNTRGTLWNGDGDLVFRTKASNAIALANIRWRMSKNEFLHGRISGQFAAEPVASNHIEQLIVDRDYVHARSIRLELPAKIIRIIDPNIAASGVLQIDLPEVRWSAQAVTASGHIKWRDATLNYFSANNPISLGEVRADIKTDSEGVKINLLNQDGQLTLRGQIRAAGLSQWEGFVDVSPSTSAAAELHSWLKQIGQPMGEGTYRIALSKIL